MLFPPLDGFEVVVGANPAKGGKSVWFSINVHKAKQSPLYYNLKDSTAPQLNYH